MVGLPALEEVAMVWAGLPALEAICSRLARPGGGGQYICWLVGFKEVVARSYSKPLALDVSCICGFKRGYIPIYIYR